MEAAWNLIFNSLLSVNGSGKSRKYFAILVLNELLVLNLARYGFISQIRVNNEYLSASCSNQCFRFVQFFSKIFDMGSWVFPYTINHRNHSCSFLDEAKSISHLALVSPSLPHPLPAKSKMKAQGLRLCEWFSSRPSFSTSAK